MRGDPFVLHLPSPAAQETAAQTRALYRALRDHLRTLPYTRETALALTHLQTSALLAHQAIALSDPEAETLE